MSFQQGLSGLNAASKELDVVGNNIANSSVVGFKSARTEFADMFAASLTGTGTTEVGIGTRVAAINQQFTQGTISSTSNPLDVAINGKGFFRMAQNGVVTYSRNGQFHFDEQGFLVNSGQLRVTGYGADTNGNIIATLPSDIKIVTADVAPQKSTSLLVGANLDSRDLAPPTATFSMTDPTSYNNSTSASVFDSLGNSHTFSMYFVKTATAGRWNAYASADGGALANVNLGAGAGNPLVLDFNSSGKLTTTMPATSAVTLSNGAASPLSFALDFATSTQFGSAFSVNALTQDGFASGRLSGLNVSEDGVIQGRYSNGQSKDLAQIVLVDFADPQGLQPLGSGQWAATSSSGQPLIGVPGSSVLGVLQSSAVEDSNVDLTSELVNLITAQRTYQANAQTIKTQDEG